MVHTVDAGKLKLDAKKDAPTPAVFVIEQHWGPSAKVGKRRFLRGWQQTLSKRHKADPARTVAVIPTRGRTHYAVEMATGDDTLLRMLVSREAMEAMVDLYAKCEGREPPDIGRRFYSMVFRIAENLEGKWRKEDGAGNSTASTTEDSQASGMNKGDFK